jgi:PAS domain S-box-containing protein
MRAEDRSTALVDAVPDAVLVIDGSGRLVHVNAATECLFGRTREELVGRHHDTVLGEAFTTLLARALAGHDGGRTVHRAGPDLDVHGRRRDGTEFPVEVNFTVGELDGEVEVVASVRDVTERRAAEAELRTALSLLSATLESTADGILVVGGDGRISGANQRFVDLWRIPPDLMAAGDDDQLLGYVLDQLVDAPAFLAKVHDLYEHPGAESNDVLEFHDGRIFERYSRPQRVGDEIVGRVWSFRDITESRDRELELREARRAAVAAARAKSDFLATMSHEIRTPMNGVIGLTGLLLETGLDDVQRRYAAGVRGAGEALLAIVDDILDFSKLEAGKVDLESVDFSPRELVEELGVLLADTAAGHGLEFLVRCAEPLPAAVTGDPRRLRQALINLAGNAIKFTPAGEVAVSVSADGNPDHVVGEPVRLRFEVSDTGIGIDRETLGRLFEPFSQADASTTRRFGGTGLGLAISSRLVDAMDGRLDVDSEPGAGSTFAITVTLPVAPGTTRPPRDPARLRPLSLVVVDDNESNRQILAADAEALGIGAVVAVGDAGSALALLRAAAHDGRPYDLALLDLLMPGTDGLELAEMIAADPALRQTGLLILTSGGGLDVARARAAGVSQWVTKPVRRDELGEALLHVLDRREDPMVPAVRSAVPAPRTASRTGRILVAEDNAVNQMVALGLLETLGYRATLAVDGRQALAELEAAEYDAVLMDCHMPEMDGFRATAELRRREAGGRRTPVIAMTAGVLDEDRERCLAAGMDDFVAKPIDAEDLRRTLARWVGDEVAGPAQDPRPPTEPVLDHDQLDELRRIGPEDGWGVLPAVVRVFLEGADELAARVRGNAAAGELTAAGDAAHTLKGAAGNVGADRLVAACHRVERAADAGTVPDEALLAAVEDELQAAENELRRLLEQAP